jgi:hypothetical protein
LIELTELIELIELTELTELIELNRLTELRKLTDLNEYDPSNLINQATPFFFQSTIQLSHPSSLRHALCALLYHPLTSTPKRAPCTNMTLSTNLELSALSY